MSTKSVDLSHWVGRSESSQDVASRSAAIGLRAVLDRPGDPDDADRARLSPVGHWLQFTPMAAMSELGTDGHPRLGGFMPPLDLPRRMWAGSRIRYHAPITVGQQLERTTTIESITPKEGSTGRLCFVVLRHEVAADGVSALTEHQTIVYREAGAPDPDAARPPRPATAAPEGWDWVQEERSGEVRLFRYSALTFNAHRIHYDASYASGVEGYPGLVVHGPLSATLVMHAFLDRHPEAQLTSFEFSARSPVFANETVHVVGRDAATTEDAPPQTRAHELAVIAPGGGTAIVARIEYS